MSRQVEPPQRYGYLFAILLSQDNSVEARDQSCRRFIKVILCCVNHLLITTCDYKVIDQKPPPCFLR